MQRIIFLDIDGVLNHREYLLNWNSEETGMAGQIDPLAVARVNTIAKEIGAVVVVSSTWRGHPDTHGHLLARGLDCKIIGDTPELRSNQGWSVPRGLEIQAWMTANGCTAEEVVILDDDGDMAHLVPRLVQTSFSGGGLLDHHVDKAIQLFGLAAKQ